MGFINNIKEEFKTRSQIKAIEKKEYKKARIKEAERYAKKKARLETNLKLKKIKQGKKTKGIFGIEAPKIKIEKPKPMKINPNFSLYKATKPRGKNDKSYFSMGK